MTVKKIYSIVPNHLNHIFLMKMDHYGNHHLKKQIKRKY